MNTNELILQLESLLEATYDLPLSDPFDQKRYYGNWLAQHYYYIRHTTRLLALAASKLDPSSPLHRRFLEHAAEEQGHEKMILNDLRTLGFSVEDFPEYPATAQMYQAQYFLVEYVSPLSLLGYPLYLESLSCRFGPHIYSLTQSSYGEKASNFIRVHAEQDEDHISSLHKILAGLGPEDYKQVAWSLKQTAYSYQGILKEIKAAHPAESKTILPLKKLKAA